MVLLLSYQFSDEDGKNSMETILVGVDCAIYAECRNEWGKRWKEGTKEAHSRHTLPSLSTRALKIYTRFNKHQSALTAPDWT